VGKKIFPKITLMIKHILQEDQNYDGRNKIPYWVGKEWYHTADTLEGHRFCCITNPKQNKKC
jgi:hypothetical protein